MVNIGGQTEAARRADSLAAVPPGRLVSTSWEPTGELVGLTYGGDSPYSIPQLDNTAKLTIPSLYVGGGGTTFASTVDLTSQLNVSNGIGALVTKPSTIPSSDTVYLQAGRNSSDTVGGTLIINKPNTTDNPTVTINTTTKSTIIAGSLELTQTTPEKLLATDSSHRVTTVGYSSLPSADGAVLQRDPTGVCYTSGTYRVENSQGRCSLGASKTWAGRSYLQFGGAAGSAGGQLYFTKVDDVSPIIIMDSDTGAVQFSRLTASTLVGLDGSKNIASLTYSQAGTGSSVVQRASDGSVVAGKALRASTSTARANLECSVVSSTSVLSIGGNSDSAGGKLAIARVSGGPGSLIEFDTANSIITLPQHAASKWLVLDGSKNVVTADPPVTPLGSGSYTPTTHVASGVTVSSWGIAYYKQAGPIVFTGGIVTISAATASTGYLHFTLPVASAIASSAQESTVFGYIRKSSMAASSDTVGTIYATSSGGGSVMYADCRFTSTISSSTELGWAITYMVDP